MDVRMLPLRHVFERFPRLVRDLARQQGKQVELVLQGEDTRVDKAVIDEIGEPLVHLIRNAVDHGIEPPAVRAARGKPPTGTILLSAAQESNQVVITLVDDGGGIDAAEVRRRAVERGIVRADEALTDRDAIQLIFTEGFSTARTVTDVSGRGVGLDVVVRSMEQLNGLIEAETIPGAGTKFTLQLPLTLAIITVLMVEVGGAVYALPSGAVVESLRFPRSEVTRIGGRDTLRVRDRLVPLVHLAELFGVSEADGGDCLRRDRGPRGEAPRAHRGPPPRAAGRGDQGPRPRGRRGRRSASPAPRSSATGAWCSSSTWPRSSRAAARARAGGPWRRPERVRELLGPAREAVPQDARPALPLPERHLRGGARAAALRGRGGGAGSAHRGGGLGEDAPHPRARGPPGRPLRGRDDPEPAPLAAAVPQGDGDGARGRRSRASTRTTSSSRSTSASSSSTGRAAPRS